FSTGFDFPRRGPSRNWTPALSVRDHNGQQLAYVYFEDEPGRRSAAKWLSNDYCWRGDGLAERCSIGVARSSFCVMERAPERRFVSAVSGPGPSIAGRASGSGPHPLPAGATPTT